MAGTLLLLSGSTRSGSVNTAALDTVAGIGLDGVAVERYDGLAGLPAFNPDDDDDGERLPAAVVELRRAVDEAVALLVCTPEYAGTLPGSFKNLLDWLIGATPGLLGKRVGYLNVGAGSPTGAAGAHATLRTVLGYARAEVVEEACRDVAVSRSEVDTDGRITTSSFAETAADVVRALVAGV